MDNTENKPRVNVNAHSGIGLIWIAGWLFTIGYLKLSFWSGLLAMILWPYNLGMHLAS